MTLTKEKGLGEENPCFYGSGLMLSPLVHGWSWLVRDSHPMVLCLFMATSSG